MPYDADNDFDFDTVVQVLEDEADAEDCLEFEDDGQPDEYTEWQDFQGGDDWDHGQFDSDW